MHTIKFTIKNLLILILACSFIIVGEINLGNLAVSLVCEGQDRGFLMSEAVVVFVIINCVIFLLMFVSWRISRELRSDK